jgi:hypothetical protein
MVKTSVLNMKTKNLAQVFFIFNNLLAVTGIQLCYSVWNLNGTYRSWMFDIYLSWR